MTVEKILDNLGIDAGTIQRGRLAVRSPIDGQQIASLHVTRREEVDDALDRSTRAFRAWRLVPAPKRGELIRRFGDELRKYKAPLAELITLESGKIRQESLGEVQEMIDICDFAVGLSRQLYGLTIASERPGHRLMETWHPLGPIAVITAFNFPGAVWSWNFALAIVCGDPVVWKPSEKAVLVAMACRELFDRVARGFDDVPAEGLLEVIVGGREAAETLARDARMKLVSATGSTRMGKDISPLVAGRLGRLLLELGGNNAAIVAPSADLELAIRGIVFSAVGTAGQRCTSLRRLIVHDSLYGRLVPRLIDIYASIRIGDPRDEGVLVGPLIEGAAYDRMMEVLALAREKGGRVHAGTRVLENTFPDAYYVQPAIVELSGDVELVQTETFAPILYASRYREFREAIDMNNAVPQGLSSSIFTNDMREADAFVAADGSDCGIANVNVGPSGAEIGGAFGGEKDTGGGREAGSDAWKNYMRRATNTVNFSTDLPLAQGIVFQTRPSRQG